MTRSSRLLLMTFLLLVSTLLTQTTFVFGDLDLASTSQTTKKKI